MSKKATKSSLVIALTLLLLACNAIFTSAAVSISTFGDAQFSTPQTSFGEQSYVYVWASDTISCCDQKSMDIIVNNSVQIVVSLNDMGTAPDKFANDGYFSGSFQIRTDPPDEANDKAQMFHLQTGTINVQLTQLSRGSGTFTADFNPPATPDAPNLAKNNDDIDIDWSVSGQTSDIRDYIIYRSTQSIPDTPSPTRQTVLDQAAKFSTPSQQYTDTTAQDGVVYWYAIAAVDDAGNIGNASLAAQIQLEDTTSPNRVTTLQVTPQPGGSLRLTWSNPGDNLAVTSYNIWRAQGTGNAPSTSGSPWQTTTSTSYTNTNTGDNYYSYAVAAEDSAGNVGQPSSAVGAYSDDTAPNSITGLTSAILPGGIVRLTFNEVGAQTYEVIASTARSEVESDNAPAVAVSDRSPIDITLTDQNYVAIVPIDQVGNRGDIQEIAQVQADNQAPPLPSDFDATVNNNGTITLEWSSASVSDLDRYNLYKTELITGQPVNDIVDMNRITTIRAGSPTIYYDKDVVHGSTYQYGISVSDQTGNTLTEPNMATASAIDTEVSLRIIHPEADAQIDGSTAIVLGVTDPLSTVTIQLESAKEFSVTADDTGAFMSVVTLDVGNNVLTITSEDVQGNSNTFTQNVERLAGSTEITINSQSVSANEEDQVPTRSIVDDYDLTSEQDMEQLLDFLNTSFKKDLIALLDARYAQDFYEGSPSIRVSSSRSSDGTPGSDSTSSDIAATVEQSILSALDPVLSNRVEEENLRRQTNQPVLGRGWGVFSKSTSGFSWFLVLVTIIVLGILIYMGWGMTVDKGGDPLQRNLSDFVRNKKHKSATKEKSGAHTQKLDEFLSVKGSDHNKSKPSQKSKLSNKLNIKTSEKSEPEPDEHGKKRKHHDRGNAGG